MEQVQNDIVFIDMQGFKTYRNKFIVKEFCLIHGNFYFHEIIKSPIDYHHWGDVYKCMSRWATLNHHGLDFQSGDMTVYKLIQSTLNHVKDKTIVVKGAEKKEWVKNLYENFHQVRCENIEDWSGFDFSYKTNQDISKICHFHGAVLGGCHCALSQAQELRTFFNKDVYLNTIQAQNWING